jgi:multidrug efflux system membrane fusion protein
MHGELPRQIWAKTSRRNRRYLVSGLILILVAAALYYVFGASNTPTRSGGRFGADGGPVPVVAIASAKADVPVYLNAVGTTKALNTVTVSPQVDGKLLSVGFAEGDDVKLGDVLAVIDPTLYKAQLDQAIAKKAQDEALLSNAKLDLDRYEKLAATNAINRQQADTQKALVAQDAAQVQSDEAAVESAQATLAYTNIVAPIDGRTGIRQVDQGNIVHASSSPAIVVITQLKPISIFFNLPQQDIGQVNTAFAKSPLKVDAQQSDNDAVIDSGTLKVLDNQVDPTTGTVKLKAEFPNANLQLWPGQFVNIRLLIDTLKQVVVIPTGAVQRGPTGTFVFVVKDDNTVTMRPVTVTMQDEIQTVVSNGLQPPERVVTTGFVRLTESSKVTLTTADGTPAAGAPAGRRQRGGDGQRNGNGPRANALPGSPPITPPSAPP